MPFSPLIDALLADAGIRDKPASLTPFPRPGWTNRTELLTTESGDRYVFRRYRWPFDFPEPKRLEKEAWLSEFLRRHGVPVPRILATARDGDQAAALVEYVDGDLLGDLEGAPAHVWRDAGEGLRHTHAIALEEVGLDHQEGMIVGKRVRPTRHGSLGGEQRAVVRHHAQRLADRDPPVAIDLDALFDLTDRIKPILDGVQLTLIHNDPHAWNVMARREGDGHAGAVWLDWEYARVSDPAFDLARVEVFRLQDIGPTPAAFYDGYGRRPEEPFHSFYVLSLYLWMADDRLSGGTGLSSYEDAMEYVTRIDDEVARIRAMI